MKAFISSTFSDLQDHRVAVADVLERLGLGLARMEKLGARPVEPSRACLDEVEDTDIFVGIYAHRYGYIPPNSRVSITEAEFNHATALRRPTFCFLVEEDYVWDSELIEGGDAGALLGSFKERIGSLVVRDTFTTPQVLATRVAAAVGRYLIADPRRSGAAAVSQSARSSIADSATAVFVDIMRLACVSASPQARAVNQSRHSEFVGIADHNLSELRGQISRLSQVREADLVLRCTRVDSRLAWCVQRLRHSPTLGSPWSDFVRILRKASEEIDALASFASPEYYSARIEEISPIFSQAPFLRPVDLLNPDRFVRRRFAMQNAVIDLLQDTAVLAIATIHDDMDRTLAIPYFTIDRELLRLAAEAIG
jgi:hypothetical protein